MSARNPTGSLSWKLARLRAMGAPEIAWRVQQKLRQASERAGWAPVAPAPRGLAPQPPRIGVLFPGLAADAAAVRAAYPAPWRERCREEAERILRGEADVFGVPRQVGWPPRWRTDPETGLDAGTPFYTALLHPDPLKVGDYRAVWEVNRHAALVTLARAAVVCGDPRYATACLTAAEDFLRENPVGRGINWVSALEIALRALAWSAAWSFLEAGGFARTEQRAAWSEAIAAMLAYVRRNRSAFSSANNHLVGELAAEVIVPCVFPEWAHAARERRAALAALAAEIEAQIHADGVGAEQSVHYLCFTLELAVLAALAAERAGDEVPRVLWQRAAAAARFLRLLADERGGLPDLGDSDDAVALPLGAPPLAMPRVLGRLIAERAGDAALAPCVDAEGLCVGGLDEPAFWLLGLTHSPLTAATARDAATAFADGGLCVLHVAAPQAPLTLGLDTGPLGYLSIAAHGHADPLALWLTAHGRSLIVDPGTGSYAPARRAERDYFRSTRAHATVMVDWTDCAEMRGSFLWGDRYEAQTLLAAGDGDWAAAEGAHDGYRDVKVRVGRRVHLDGAGYALVVDTVDGPDSHIVTASWPFGAAWQPDAPVTPETDVVAAHTADGGRATLTSRALSLAGGTLSDRLRWESVRGQRDPLDGWLSPQYNAVQPGWVARCSVRAALPVCLVTLLAAPRAGAAPVTLVRADVTGPRSIRLVVRRADGGDDDWWIVLGPQPESRVLTLPYPYETLPLRGGTVSVRCRYGDGEEPHISARGYGDFRVRDRVVRQGESWTWRWATAGVEERQQAVFRGGRRDV